MTKLINKVTFQDVKDSEARIARAQRKVANTMNVFSKAAKDVEKANIELAKAIDDSEAKITEYMESINQARATKDKAQVAVQHNEGLLAKLNEFVPMRG